MTATFAPYILLSLVSLSPVSQILISADDEMDESDEDDVRRLPGLKTVKKKKLRMGIPV